MQRTYNDVMGKSSLTNNRIYFYVVKIRKVAEIMPNRFLNPTAQDTNIATAEIAGRKRSNRIKVFRQNSGGLHDSGQRFYRGFSPLMMIFSML